MGIATVYVRYDDGRTEVRQEAGGAHYSKVKGRLDWYRKQGHRFSYETCQGRGIGTATDKDVEALRKAIKEGLGAVISVNKARHAVTLVDISERTYSYAYSYPDGRRGYFDDHAAYYIDSNDVLAGKKVVRSMCLWELRNRHWDGWYVIIRPSSK